MAQFYRSPQACVILTGASRGFGVALATTFAEHYRDQFPLPADNSAKGNDQLIFVLIARSTTQLELASEQLKLIDSRIKVHLLGGDLSKAETVETIEQYLQKSKLLDGQESIGHFVLLHNAGSIGNSNQRCKSISVRDAAQRDAYYRLNVYSVMEMTWENRFTSSIFACCLSTYHQHILIGSQPTVHWYGRLLCWQIHSRSLFSITCP